MLTFYNYINNYINLVCKNYSSFILDEARFS